jgi:hypothetical protein
MRAKDLYEFVSPQQMAEIEHFADSLWGKLGIDVAFTRHFFDRVNDTRNGKDITAAEMVRLFKKEYERYGKHVAALDDEQQAVFNDLMTSINLPFVIKDDGKQKTLVAKTVMRKDDFKSPDPIYKVK